MSDQVKDFLSDLAVDGEQEGDTTSFTLSSEKAREKLKKFALEHPENYFLLVLAALHTLGARNFELTIDADDMEVVADCTLEKVGLLELWSHVAGGKPSPQADGLRLLALAMLTSVRFQKAVWTVECSDQGQGFRYLQAVSKGDLEPAQHEEIEGAFENTRVHLKRKAMGQVTSRFFAKLKDRLLNRAANEEGILNERLFPGVLESFLFNGKPLDCDLVANDALATLHSGNVPELLKARYQYEIESNLSLVAIIYPKSEPNDGELGDPATVHWLWHGLKMGTTELGISYKFARVFVVADGFQTDLGFGGLAGTWQRQKAQRLARESVRTLLQNLAVSFTENHEARGSVDEEVESILLDVLAERIDVRRSRHRLASFNRALLACPLFRVSLSDGTDTRYTLGSLWEQLERGEPLYLFEDESDWMPVPAWPGRPTVLWSNEHQYRVLSRIFDKKAFRSARHIGLRLQKLAAVEAGGIEERSNWEPPSSQKPWLGNFLWQGNRVDWCLRFPLDTRMRGTIQVLRDSVLFFEDNDVDLPDNVLVHGEIPVKPNYQGRLDPVLKMEFSRPVLLAMIETLEKQSALGPDEIAVSTILWRHLGGEIEAWSDDVQIYERAWVLTLAEGVLSLRSPSELFEVEPPQYFIKPEDVLGQLESSFPPSLVVPDSEVEKLSRCLNIPLNSTRGFELLGARPPFEFDRRDFYVLHSDNEIVAKWDPRLDRVAVGFPLKHKIPASVGELCLHQNLKGHALQMRTLSSPFCPITICFDWSEGLPDSRGLHFADQAQTEKARELARAVAAWAATRFFSTSTTEELDRYHPSLLENIWFELWTIGERKPDQRVFPCTGEHWASFRELTFRKDPLNYFSDLSRGREFADQHAFWIPPALAESAEDLDPSLEWVRLDAPAEELKVEELSPSEPKPSPKVKSKPKPGAGVKQSKVQAPEPKPKKAKSASTDGKVELQTAKPVEAAEPKADIIVPSPPAATASISRLDTSTENESGPRLLPFSEEQYVQGLIELTERIGSVPFFEPFIEFLSQIKVDDSLKNPIELVDDKLSIRPWQNRFKNDEPDLVLLSSLYSIFNRQREDVLDFHEREFHALILQYCLNSSSGHLTRS